MKTYAETLDRRMAFERALSDHVLEFDRGGSYASLDGDLVCAALAGADSYFVATDFLGLVDGASTHLPEDSVLVPEDFPAARGWITFERAIDITAVSLDRGESTDQVEELAWLGNREQVVFFYEPHGTARLDTCHLAFDRIGAHDPFQRWLRAFWLLLSQQTVSETTEEVPPRAARKRAVRAGMNPTVRVIRLPRRVREGATAEHGAVDWQSRWIVSGHWRKQPWGPERKRRRPVWIAPYIKGPEDKPVKESAHRLFVASAP